MSKSTPGDNLYTRLLAAYRKAYPLKDYNSCRDGLRATWEEIKASKNEKEARVLLEIEKLKTTAAEGKLKSKQYFVRMSHS